MKSRLLVYKKLDFLKKYSLKFLFISFVGIHIPLLGIILYLISVEKNEVTPLEIIILALILTLVATSITLFLLNELLKPLKMIQEGLDQYIQTKQLPDLPEHYQDELGQVMSKLQNTLEQLQHLLDEKHDLIALLSHDLRSPVNQIKGLVALLQDSEEELQQEYLQVMDGLCTQHATLLSEVLFMLKQEEENTAHKVFEYVDLIKLLDECIQEHHTSLEKKDVSVSLTSSVDNVQVNMERTFFQQAIRNLLENAIKFSFPKGAIDIRVETVSDQLQIHIRDYGMGFKPEVAHQLFDKFTRQGKKGTFNEPSTGLGLHLTKKIIEQHIGRVEASSEGQGKGATFTIRLTQWKSMSKTMDVFSVEN
ncbi:sensor histidine kinase [Catalinimonas niigatensis]|uniref:sensor histidine kinase n=1 Tax=Catalinimonas niigatensis TaxID=1397264 RepID=UPI002665D291|nr:HAMP domain-containing sensor histidine kinase [Catalinimonas niigatensis]WPP52871.1 HAMP domain-containing sensor histidine kinase [Catalinimonas niigatensis]